MSALPAALSVHRTDTRVRLRVPERRGDDAYFEAVERAVAAFPEVHAVRVDPRTASVLVRHDGDLERLAERAARAGLFTWRPEPIGDVVVELRERLRAADASIHARTAGRWSLDAIAFYALLGASAYQLAQGIVLPPGSRSSPGRSRCWSAATTAGERSPRRPGRRPVEPLGALRRARRAGRRARSR